MIRLCVLLLAVLLVSPEAPAGAEAPRYRQVLGAPYYPRYDGSGRSFSIRLQGNDSNCDYLVVATGVQNTGGDGEAAYWAARALVAQQPRDFREAFYTVLGPNGSDQPFSVDNLGAAPEAFLGVYEALGYNTVMLAATPHVADAAFATAIMERLVADPSGSFAHLWITYDTYDPQARTLTVPETGEQAHLLYPYHEVAAMADPAAPGQLIVLDGLVGYPYAVDTEKLASLLRGFNRAIVVSGDSGGGHLYHQLTQQGGAYVAPTLGGAYLGAARGAWGADYAAWGEAIDQPYRRDDGAVVLPGTYVQYERYADGEPLLAALGVTLRDELRASGVPLAAVPEGGLANGMRGWVAATFGSVESFSASFGQQLTGEFWLSRQQLADLVLQGVPFGPLDAGSDEGFVAVLTERALLVWSPSSGTHLAPLGRVYHERLRRAVLE